MDEEEEEEVFIEGTESSEFDQIIGAIEDIAISDDFQALQNNLLETYCHHFEVTLNKYIFFKNLPTPFLDFQCASASLKSGLG